MTNSIIDFLNQGGGPGNKALTPLGLTDLEKEALIIFLEQALAGDEIKIKPPAIPWRGSAFKRGEISRC